MADMQYIHKTDPGSEQTICGLEAADQKVDSIGTCPWCRRGEKFPLRTRTA